MPKDTYYNLSEVKQEKIIKAITKEFSLKGYQKASIDSIANSAGISKGSLYQYFENKKEMYFYIIELSGDKKATILSKYIKNKPTSSLFELLEIMINVGIDYAIEHPELYRIYQDIQQSASKEIKEEFNKRVRNIGYEIYRKFIIDAIEKNEIRDDINVDLIAYLIYRFMKSFGDYIFDKKNFSNKNIRDEYIKQLIEILKNGLKNKEELI